MTSSGTRVLSWVAALGIGLLAFQSQHPLEADPVADFSFALQYAPSGSRYRRITAQRLARVFENHLEPKPSVGEARALAEHLLELCRKHRFDPAFILSLVQVESSFRSHVVSPAGAVGLMQLMPATARVVARRYRLPWRGIEALREPRVNLAYGMAYLGELRDRYADLPPYFHIAAYNLGPSKLDQLRSRKGFKPVKTQAYYERIKRGVHLWRYFPLEGGREG